MTGRPTPAIAPLVAAVQANCDIADARHAADLSLCTYLLQMREFYRWEQALPFGATLPREAVGAWIAQRERGWAAVEASDFVPLPDPGRSGIDFDPFDTESIAPVLAAEGLAYGAALAGRDRPSFFLAELDLTRPLDGGAELQVCGRELARGLFAPPAALIGDMVVLRRESLARWVWEKYEAFGIRHAEGAAFKAVVDAYGLDRDFNAALPRLLDEQGETLVLHEIGEHRLRRRLDPGWAELRLATADRRTELQLRAVRDLIADLETTLPTLLARDDPTALHFWFAAFDGHHATLCPVLPAAYARWRAGDGGRLLRTVCESGAAHFKALADELLALHAQHGEDAAPAIVGRLNHADAVFCG